MECELKGTEVSMQNEQIQQLQNGAMERDAQLASAREEIKHLESDLEQHAQLASALQQLSIRNKQRTKKTANENNTVDVNR